MTASSAAALARAHYERFCGAGRASLVVPEWGEEDAPLVVYWSPFTLGDHVRVFGAEDKKRDAGVYAWVLARKAEDAGGKKLFAEQEDLHILKHQADGQIVRRVAEAIMTAPSVQEFADRLKTDSLRMAMHALADRLGKTIAEIEAMTVAEFRETVAYHDVRKKNAT